MTNYSKKKLDISPTKASDTVNLQIKTDSEKVLQDDILSITIPEDNLDVSRVLKIVSNNSPTEFSPDSTSFITKPLKTYSNKRKQSKSYDEDTPFDLPIYPEELECTFNSDSNSSSDLFQSRRPKSNNLLKISEKTTASVSKKSKKSTNSKSLQKKVSPRKTIKEAETTDISLVSSSERKKTPKSSPKKKVTQKIKLNRSSSLDSYNRKDKSETNTPKGYRARSPLRKSNRLDSKSVSSNKNEENTTQEEILATSQKSEEKIVPEIADECVNIPETASALPDSENDVPSSSKSRTNVLESTIRLSPEDEQKLIANLTKKVEKQSADSNTSPKNSANVSEVSENNPKTDIIKELFKDAGVDANEMENKNMDDIPSTKNASDIVKEVTTTNSESVKNVIDNWDEKRDVSEMISDETKKSDVVEDDKIDQPILDESKLQEPEITDKIDSNQGNYYESDDSIESPMFEKHVSVESPIFRKEDKYSLAQKVLDFKLDVSELDVLFDNNSKSSMNSSSCEVLKEEIIKIVREKEAESQSIPESVTVNQEIELLKETIEADEKMDTITSTLEEPSQTEFHSFSSTTSKLLEEINSFIQPDSNMLTNVSEEMPLNIFENSPDKQCDDSSLSKSGSSVESILVTSTTTELVASVDKRRSSSPDEYSYLPEIFLSVGKPEAKTEKKDENEKKVEIFEEKVHSKEESSQAEVKNEASTDISEVQEIKTEVNEEKSKTEKLDVKELPVQDEQSRRGRGRPRKKQRFINKETKKQGLVRKRGRPRKNEIFEFIPECKVVSTLILKTSDRTSIKTKIRVGRKPSKLEKRHTRPKHKKLRRSPKLFKVTESETSEISDTQKSEVQESNKKIRIKLKRLEKLDSSKILSSEEKQSDVKLTIKEELPQKRRSIKRRFSFPPGDLPFSTLDTTSDMAQPVQVKKESSEFQIGDIVWAKVGAFPYWPSLITNDPHTQVYSKSLPGRTTRLSYHVNFFGDKGRRSWIPQTHLFYFVSKNDLSERYRAIHTRKHYNLKLKHADHPSGFFIPKTKRGKWNVAVSEAARFLKVAEIDRIELFCSTFFDDSKQQSKIKRKRKLDREKSTTPEITPKRIKIEPENKTPKEELKIDINIENESLDEDMPLSKIVRRSSVTSQPLEKLEKSKVEALQASSSTKRAKSLLNKKDIKERSIFEDSFSDRESIKDQKSEVRDTPSPLLSKKKISLFKGITNERVCQICLKPNKVLRCKGLCFGFYHVNCDRIRNNLAAIDTNEFEESSNCTTDSKDSVDLILRKNNGGFNKSLAYLSKDDSDSSDVSVKSEPVSNEGSSCVTKSLILEEQIDLKMMEVMQKLLEKTHYGDSSDEADEIDLLESSTSKQIKEESPLPESTLSKPQPPKESFKCISCLSGNKPPCYVCNKKVSKSGVETRQKCILTQCGKYYHKECLKDWPQTKWSYKNNKSNEENLCCPFHVCHTCTSDDPRAPLSRFSNEKLTRCLRYVCMYVCIYCIKYYTKCLMSDSHDA